MQARSSLLSYYNHHQIGSMQRVFTFFFLTNKPWNFDFVSIVKFATFLQCSLLEKIHHTQTVTVCWMIEKTHSCQHEILVGLKITAVHVMSLDKSLNLMLKFDINVCVRCWMNTWLKTYNLPGTLASIWKYNYSPDSSRDAVLILHLHFSSFIHVTLDSGVTWKSSVFFLW